MAGLCMEFVTRGSEGYRRLRICRVCVSPFARHAAALVQVVGSTTRVPSRLLFFPPAPLLVA